MLHLPHADHALRGEAARAARTGVRASAVRPGRRSRAARRRRRVLLRLPPDQQGAARHARKLQRRLRRRSTVERRTSGRSTARSKSTRATRGSCTARRRVTGRRSRSTSASRSCARRATRCYTRRWDRTARSIGELPEQVPYQEWLHSEFKNTQSCQSCHMPVVKEQVPITRVFGDPARRRVAACVRGGELLHAADAEPLSRRSRRRRAAAGADGRGRCARSRFLQSQAARVCIDGVRVARRPAATPT